MIYYHFTESFLSQNKNDEKVIEILKTFFEENIDKNSIKGIGKISSFTKSIYVFRNKTPYFEVVMEERIINHNDHKLTVYFVRGKKNLKNSLQEYVDIRDGKWTEKKPFDPRDEISFIQSFENKNKTDGLLTKIPDEYVLWQNDYKLKITYDIYETGFWVDYAVNNSPKDGLRIEDSKLFLNVLKYIINQNQKGELVNTNLESNFFHYKSEDFNIELLYIVTKIFDKEYFILFGGSHILDQPDYSRQINDQFETYFSRNFSTLQEISQICLKAYPSWTLKEDEMWLKIQKNSEYGNLSLLPEQTGFLEDFKFPKYINGQAGSGKSTILYYLFSNIYYYKCAEEITGDIIFITENEKLLKHTINSIYDLVLNNPEFQLSAEDTDLINLKKHFYSFKDFLRSFLTDQESFSEERYLDFSKFKILYETSVINNSIKRKFSAEIVWFTITTYIYGLDLTQKLTTENYNSKMPKEGKEIISLEDFVIIEREILKPFYDKLLSDEGYWNKQTLIKYLVDTNSINKRYEVIFCDESQDFSKVELEFIISLSLYSSYNLEDVSQFPIVFAGDALQTVNPTGFRSEVLTSMIYKSLTNPLVGFKLNQKDLVFTPEYNYRSSPTIVSISNVIQNWRKSDLKEDVKEFQKPKRENKYSNQNLNIFVELDKFNSDPELQKKIEFKTIIVPVNSEEIDAFKEQFPILKEFKNIISAIDAKGLDFSEVVIFGFGDLFISSNFGIYEKKYFYNKLYVAVTRTRDELIIIDSTNSKKLFWDLIINNFIETEWNKRNLKLNHVDELLVANNNSVIQSKLQIVEDDAKTQKEIGWLNRNIPLLKIASNHFLKIGNYQEYYFCLGLIEELNEDFDKAADYYLNKELIQNSEAKKRALFALWNGQKFERINSIVSIDKIELKVLSVLSTIFLDKSSIMDEEDVDFLEDHLKVLFEIKKNTIWLDEFKELFIENIKLNIQSDLIYRIYEILNQTFKELLTIGDRELIGTTLFLNGQYSYALNIYESLGARSINYYKCKAEIAKRRRKHEEYVLNLGKIIYEDFGENSLNFHQKGIVANDIIYYFLENEIESNVASNDPYFYAFLLLAKLYVNDVKYLDEFLEYDKVVENFKLLDRENELLSFYYFLLQESEFTHLIYNRTIFDWANLYIKLYKVEDLNNEYKVLCKLKNIKFVEFIDVGLEESKKHITDIKVRNFKQFDELEISNIGLINLVVGDNNIGKTSSLEMFLITADQDEYYKRLLYSYIERSKLIPDKISTTDKSEYYFEIDKNFTSDFLSYENPVNPTFDILAGRRIYKLNVVLDETQSHQANYTSISFIKSRKRIETLPLNEILKLPYYSYGKGYGKDLAIFYDKYIRTDRVVEDSFLANLKLFIPGVINVLITSDGGICIRCENDTIDKPLHSFGDGANKLFRILMLLTVHKGNVLLIDEIDSGIHFSRFKKFWEIITTIAFTDKTQLICTTHNLECINYFASALSQPMQEVARVIQLIRTNRLKATTYDYENFIFALEDSFELRG